MDYMENLSLAERRIGETRRMNNGLQATIIEYKQSMDMKIRFENGIIREHVRYENFYEGCIGLTGLKSGPKNIPVKMKLGETREMENGLKAELVSYSNCRDITIKFENNVVLEHTTYAEFNEGVIDLEKYNKAIRLMKYSIIGEIADMKNGLGAKVIDYNGDYDITIMFDTGLVREHVSISDFRAGVVGLRDSK